MLKDMILGYVENIDALRDFADSIKLLLEEHTTRIINTNEPELIKRVEKLQSVLGSMPQEKIDEIIGKSLDTEPDKELKELLGFDFTLQRKKDETGKGHIEFGIPLNIVEASDSVQQVYFKTERQKELLYKSSLITLTSTVELFLSQLLHFYFEQFPDAVGSDVKFFSLDELKSIGSIEDAKKHLIESKVENILRDSLEEWIKFLKERVKLSMGYIDPVKDKLLEIYQRRNLLVHNGGKVNSIYLSKVAPQLRKNVSRGDLLSVKPKYLNKALDLFELNFVLIAAELWKKLAPKDEERPDTLVAIAYKHLLNERWEIAEGLSYFVMSDKQTSEKSQMYGQLNYWQSVKWQGRFENIRKEVEQADFSAKDPLYQLAQLALLNRNEEFFSLLPEVLRSQKLTTGDLQQWPLFRELRKEAAFDSFIQEEPSATEIQLQEREESIH